MRKQKKYCLPNMSECFGKGNFFLELQDHGIPEQKLVNQQLLRMSQETGILSWWQQTTCITPMQEDAEPHDILLCLQTGKKLSGRKPNAL